MPTNNSTLNDIRVPLFLVFVSSFFVFIEPAPFDIFLCGLSFYMLAKGYGNLKYLSSLAVILSLYAFARFVTIPLAVETSAAVRFFSITTYLSFSSLILAGVIAKFGPRSIHIMVLGMYVGVFFTGIFVLAVKLNIIPSLNDIVLMYRGTRVRGFFKDANVLGPALVPVVLYALLQLHQSSKRYKMLEITVLITSTVLVFLSFSRGAWVTMLGAIGLFYTLRSIEKGIGSAISNAFLGGVVLSGLGCVLYVVASSGGYLELLEQRTKLQSYDDDRFAVHEILLHEVGDNSWGHGPGQVRNFLERNYAFEGSNDAHNTYLRNAFEYGWVGILIYIYLILSTLYVGLKLITKKDELSGLALVGFVSLVSVLVSGFTIDTLHWRHFWWEISFVWGLAAYQNQINANKSALKSN